MKLLILGLLLGLGTGAVAVRALAPDTASVPPTPVPPPPAVFAPDGRRLAADAIHALFRDELRTRDAGADDLPQP